MAWEGRLTKGNNVGWCSRLRNFVNGSHRRSPRDEAEVAARLWIAWSYSYFVTRIRRLRRPLTIISSRNRETIKYHLVVPTKQRPHLEATIRSTRTLSSNFDLVILNLFT